MVSPNLSSSTTHVLKISPALRLQPPHNRSYLCIWWRNAPIRHHARIPAILAIALAATVSKLGEGGDDDPRAFARENENTERIENIFLGLAGLMASAPAARSPRPAPQYHTAFTPHYTRSGDPPPPPGPGTRPPPTAGSTETGDQPGIRWSTPDGNIRFEVRGGIEAGAGRTRTWAFTTGGGPQESQGNAGAGLRNAANLQTHFPSFSE